MMQGEQVSTSLYFDRTFDCEAAKISPGEYFYTDKDMMIVTVLGSCISACIRDSKTGIGGMNHFMLPDSAAADKDSPVSESMRYGTYAMEVLINQLIRNGARRENLEAKIFGGGNVLKSFTTTNVGVRNAEFVKKYLKDEHIRVVGEDLIGYLSSKSLLLSQNRQSVGQKTDDNSPATRCLNVKKHYCKQTKSE